MNEQNLRSKILTEARVIAIVGLSNEKEKDSYTVAEYLQKQNYTIIPINPKYSEILGEKSYPSLAQVPVAIDIVNVFRKVDAIASIANEVLALPQKPKVFWMQLGIQHTEAAQLLEKAGMIVIQDECIKVVHKNFFSQM